MKTAIILHGMPSKEEYFDPNISAQSNLHWLPWIQKQLLINGILAQTPELPDPFAPNYNQWRSVFEQFSVDQKTLLIGHSCGAGFLVRWLSENDIRIGKLALIAPFIDPDGDEVPVGFFPFAIDQQLLAKAKDMVIFTSPNDDREIHDSVRKISEQTAMKVIELPNKAHFTLEGMKAEKFPELLKWLML